MRNRSCDLCMIYLDSTQYLTARGFFSFNSIPVGCLTAWILCVPWNYNTPNLGAQTLSIYQAILTNHCQLQMKWNWPGAEGLQDSCLETQTKLKAFITKAQNQIIYLYYPIRHLELWMHKCELKWGSCRLRKTFPEGKPVQKAAAALLGLMRWAVTAPQSKGFYQLKRAAVWSNNLIDQRCLCLVIQQEPFLCK